MCYHVPDLSHGIYAWSLLQPVAAMPVVMNWTPETGFLFCHPPRPGGKAGGSVCWEEVLLAALQGESEREQWGNSEISCAKTKSNLPTFNTLWERFNSLLGYVWGEFDLIFSRLWTGGNQPIVYCNIQVSTVCLIYQFTTSIVCLIYQV